MKTILLTLFFISTSITELTQAQIVQVQDGDYKFAKGIVHVSLSDTVSPGFIKKQFETLGYEILKNEIYPVRGYFYKDISDEELLALSSSNYINEITVNQNGFNEKAFLEMVKSHEMTPEDSMRSRRAFERITMQRPKNVIFNYYVTHEMALEFSEMLPEIDLKISMNSPKSITIKTVPNKENETMKTLNKLPFVESTAFIMLDNEQ